MCSCQFLTVPKSQPNPLLYYLIPEILQMSLLSSKNCPIVVRVIFLKHCFYSRSLLLRNLLWSHFVYGLKFGVSSLLFKVSHKVVLFLSVSLILHLIFSCVTVRRSWHTENVPTFAHSLSFHIIFISSPFVLWCQSYFLFGHPKLTYLFQLAARALFEIYSNSMVYCDLTSSELLFYFVVIHKAFFCLPFLTITCF